MKNKLVTTLAVCLAVTLGGTTAFAATAPSDVQGLPCENAVETLMDADIITGDTDGLYHPDQNLTRAQVSVMLAKAMDKNASNSGKKGKYSDMSGYGWAEAYIGLMSDKGVAKGYPDGTFKPGANVTVAELAAFIIRACGYSEEDLEGSWPDNYFNQALKMGLFSDGSQTAGSSGGALDPSSPATKAVAAVAIFNGLEKIQENNGSSQEQTSEYVYVQSGSFDASMTAFNGIALASDVKVYSYGKANDFVKSMTIPSAGKMGIQSVYRYKGVTAPAFYRLTSGKISEIILPDDKGFSGRAFGLILDSEKSAVSGGKYEIELTTLVSGKEMVWTCKSDFSENNAIYSDLDEYISNGDLIEMTISKGKVKDLGLGVNSDKYCKELAGEDQTASGGWDLTVTEKTAEKNRLKLSNGEYVIYSDSVIVYVLNEDGDGYDVKGLSSVKKGSCVRLYDITDDDEDEISIIIVKNN